MIVEEINVPELREALRRYMARKDVTLTYVAKKIGRSVRLVWGFLNNEPINHNFQTLYRIRDLIEKGQQGRKAKEKQAE